MQITHYMPILNLNQENTLLTVFLLQRMVHQNLQIGLYGEIIEQNIGATETGAIPSSNYTNQGKEYFPNEKETLLLIIMKDYKKIFVCHIQIMMLISL